MPGPIDKVKQSVKRHVINGEKHRAWRHERMKAMFALLNVPSKARIIDLGGTPHLWRDMPGDYTVTIVNLPGTIAPADRDPGYTYLEHDACDLSDVYEDNAFDLAFSNSTIEHVGDEANQERFARELRRLAPSYWVQTPSDRFPLEVHTWVPFYWKLPNGMRQRLLRRWRRRQPLWCDMIEGTRVLSRGRMESLFPGSRCYIERMWGFEKSYSFYVPHPTGVAAPAPAHTGQGSASA